MEKISKIKTIKANGTWDSSHGLMYKYEYTFEDNQIMNAQHKSANPFKQGDEVQYLVKGNNETYGDYGTVSKVSDFKPGQGKKDDVQLYIVRQSSLNRAIEHLSYKDHDQMTKEKITALADYYTNWVLGNE